MHQEVNGNTQSPAQHHILDHPGVNSAWPVTASLGGSSSHWQTSVGSGASASSNQQQHPLDSSHFVASVPMAGFVTPSDAELALSSKF